jgi:ferredoxin, 2Fe-2S
MKIKFLPSGQEIENDPNKSLLRLCQDNGIHINSVCKGQPKCAECRVKIVEGEHNVLPPSAAEIAVLGNNFYLDGRRLSCQVRAYGDITVDISEQVERDLNSHKKVRGFRSTGQQPKSKAVLDTMILHEKADEKKGH